MTTYTEFSLKQIDAAYINTLVDFINACRKNGAKINAVNHFQNGWHITFTDCLGDAVCNDGSYGSPNREELYPEIYQNDWNKSGKWETIGFPWDGCDVSVHNSDELARLIATYQRGEYVEEQE